MMQGLIRPARRRALLRAAGAALLPLPCWSGGARAAAPWPGDRPVRIIVPFTPGGSTDILARALAQRLGEELRQTFVVENRGGAGGTIGTEAAARATPDGYTLMMGHIGTLAVNPALYSNLSFDTATAFAPIALVATVPNILVVNPRRVAARDVAELIALAKRRGGQLTYGSGGNGSAAHIAMAAFTITAGVEMVHVPYKGTAPMMSDLIAGQIDLTLTGGPPALPPVRNGLLRALGVSSLTRLESAPEIPTIAETALPGFEAVQWYGLVGPAGMPRAVIGQLHEASQRILQEPALRAQLEAEGAQFSPHTPEAFGSFIAAERQRWGALIRQARLQPD
ncbi:tripartite tricarboxylate transporter substrate binding protein [Roseomonas sp. GC11]|uniref:Bug family tripartite tricarboxylate transporter substrate binding protein n=1 Tax=Roseomonas sp. GC11 TaxID=2950546 RepID=UPI00210DBA6A|nr:tripartite tricarboxylate transporter substrate binding protein [Roseomonas sp. GC11]MCQ4159277.1 tripartite tricarboxylate transporter substrate binding protein [Roseomonas sp. GC11]